MIPVGLFYLDKQKKDTPAMIINGVLYYFDFDKQRMVATNKFEASFVLYRFTEKDFGMAWWHKNMHIAFEWSKVKKDKPKYDLESLKKLKSKKVVMK